MCRKRDELLACGFLLMDSSEFRGIPLMKNKAVNFLNGVFLFFFFLLFSGCSDAIGPIHKNEENEREELMVTMYITDQSVQHTYLDISKTFEQVHPNIKVNLIFPGFDYEDVLKIKIASHDLPDIFDTHGWTKRRYGKLLMDLSDEKWAHQLSDSMKIAVTDTDGAVYALPISEARDGLSYNVNVLKKYHIQIPRTFTELMQAAETIKQESGGQVIPFFFAGANRWTIGQYFDYMANSLYVSTSDNEFAELENGILNKNKWVWIAKTWKEMLRKGYMNEDFAKAKYSDLPELFATDKVAFTFSSPSFANDVYQLNAETVIGIMPIPAMQEYVEPSFAGGERNTMGIWIDSLHKEAARLLINFYAKPENMSKIANATKLPSGLKNIQASHEFVSFYEKYAKTRIFPYFDRVYLPSGMWDIMSNEGLDVLVNHMSPEEFADNMQTNMKRLRQ